MLDDHEQTYTGASDTAVFLWLFMVLGFIAGVIATLVYKAAP